MGSDPCAEVPELHPAVPAPRVGAAGRRGVVRPASGHPCVGPAAAVAAGRCLILLIVALPFAGSGLLLRVVSCTAALQPCGTEFPP